MNFDVLIVDFNDSFTFNIAEVVTKMERSVKVIHYLELAADSSCLSSDKKQVVILGPGPGNPLSYLKEVSVFFHLLRERQNIFVMGICLGHQLLALILGLKIKRAHRPIHGESLEVLCFDGNYRSVQFYNSLTVCGEADGYVFIRNEHQEILSIQGERLLSYQFHPESVGTSYPSYFFGPVRDFLYN